MLGFENNRLKRIWVEGRKQNIYVKPIWIQKVVNKYFMNYTYVLQEGWFVPSYMYIYASKSWLNIAKHCHTTASI